MLTRSVSFLKEQFLTATTWLAWLLPVFAWAPLTYPGYFEFHSGFLPIFNLNNLWLNLTDLSWAPVIGQPYDLWHGERVLPYLLAVLPRALGASSATAVKWVFGASILAGALGMYGWVRRRTGAWPGLLAAAVYVFWPIGLATVYVRGALAEAVLLGLMPLLLWAVDVAADAMVGTRRSGPAAATGLLLAAAFWTQAGMAVWLAMSVLAYMLIASRAQAAAGAPELADPPRSTSGPFRRVPIPPRALPLLGWIGGLILAALGLLPLILRRGLGDGLTWVIFPEHFVYPHQLLLAGGGYGTSVPGPYDTLTFQLGLVAFGLGVVGLGIGDWGLGIGDRGSGVRELGQGDRERGAGSRGQGTGIGGQQGSRVRYLAVGVVLLCALLSTTMAAPLWRALPFLARTLTYPWQLLLLAGPWLAWLAGYGGHALQTLLPKKARETGTFPLFAALVALALLGSYGDPATGDGGVLNPPATRTPIPETPVAIFGEDEITLLSAVTAGVPGPGGRVTVLARWQALRPLPRDYTVFLHAIGPDGQQWGQIDTTPQGGRFPTSQWRPGQVITDQYQLTLKPDAPITRDYRFLLGLYQLETGQRLSTGADDKVVLR